MTTRLLPWRSFSALAGAVLLRRSMVDGPEGCYVREAGTLVSRQPAAANRSDSGWSAFCTGQGHWSRLLMCLLGFLNRALHRREAARTSTGKSADSIAIPRTRLTPHLPVEDRGASPEPAGGSLTPGTRATDDRGRAEGAFGRWPRAAILRLDRTISPMIMALTIGVGYPDGDNSRGPPWIA